MQSRIGAVSYYVPERVITNSDLAAEFPDMKIREMTRLTGVESRHVTAEDETSVDMGVQAAERLFAEHNISREIIDYVIFCSAGGDYITPASACLVQDRLKLSQQCGAVDINQGCTGYLYGLSFAEGLIASGNAENILLINSEAITKMIHPQDKANRAIFGDAGAATWIHKGDGNLKSRFVFGTDGSRYDQIIIKHGRERFPLPEFEEEDFVDDRGNIRNHKNFYMNGAEVFNFSVQKAPELVNALLEQHHLSPEQIDHYIFHQANAIIVETIGKKLKIPREKLVLEINDTGNTVSATIPIALKKSIDKGRVKRGDKLLLAGFGVGFSWAGTVIEF